MPMTSLGDVILPDHHSIRVLALTKHHYATQDYVQMEHNPNSK
jgi:hypothetical protein